MEARGASHVYGIERQTMCLSAVHATHDRNRFILGTLGIRGDNEIHVIDFDIDEGSLSALVYKHTREIRSIASVPWDSALAATVSPRAHTTEVTLYTLPGVPQGTSQGFTGDKADLAAQKVAALDDPHMPHKVVASGENPAKQLLTVSATTVTAWDFEAAQPRISHVINAPAASRQLPADPIEACAMHPAAPMLLATGDGSTLRGWDMRGDTQTFAVEYAHTGALRSVDYNPILPHLLATGGDDGVVRIWDSRSFDEPLMQIANHTHWVYSVAFNPNHDQLLLTAGGDGLVNLESAVSLSSARAVELDGYETDETERPTDGLVAQFDDHETSVYAAHWSAADPWVFASLSYDGRMVINTVPQKEKYKILL